MKLAQQLENQVFVSLTACFHGVAQWALGHEDAARSSLDRALQLAEEVGDPRRIGYCHLCLGRLAASGGDITAAVRSLRRAQHASRRGQDRVYEELATLTLLELLVAHGKRWRATRWLERRAHAARNSVSPRGALAAANLASRVDPTWPHALPGVLDRCERAARGGDVWDAFLALSELLKDPQLTDQGLSLIHI